MQSMENQSKSKRDMFYAIETSKNEGPPLYRPQNCGHAHVWSLCSTCSSLIKHRIMSLTGKFEPTDSSLLMTN
uniref:Uncharacterized protein n=1 Tax=Romanomermis culicivorax TaxID=13658 RepID=A0A915K6Q3_ROMCU